MNTSRQVVWFIFLLSCVLRLVEETRFAVSLQRTMLTALWFFILLDAGEWAKRKFKSKEKK